MRELEHFTVGKPMEAIAQLECEYLRLKVGNGDYQVCIDWAIERLLHDQEGDDLEIVLLAAATKQEVVFPLVEQIIKRYCDASILDDELVAGKYVASLRDAYLQGNETIESIDAKLTTVFRRLDYPDWLVMLSRNCEYATDMPAFEEPFEKEFAYIAGLWASVNRREEFEKIYSRAVSNQHDAKYL